MGIFFGTLVVSFYQSYQNISPYYIILLFWYPCFENLFSILRKNKLKNSPIIADDKHLHQLLFFYIQNKNLKNILFSNNFSSILINSYNLIIMLAASTNIYSSNLQVFLIVMNIIVYSICYRYLFIFRFKKK